LTGCTGLSRTSIGEGAAQRVGADEVQPAVADERRDGAHRVEDVLEAGSQVLRLRPGAVSARTCST
jgi:hypothetical protein